MTRRKGQFDPALAGVLVASKGGRIGKLQAQALGQCLVLWFAAQVRIRHHHLVGSGFRRAIFPGVVLVLFVLGVYVAVNNKNDNFDYWRRMQEGGDIWPMFNPESGMKDPRPPAGPKRN